MCFRDIVHKVHVGLKNDRCQILRTNGPIDFLDLLFTFDSHVDAFQDSFLDLDVAAINTVVFATFVGNLVRSKCPRVIVLASDSHILYWCLLGSNDSQQGRKYLYSQSLELEC